MPDVRRSAASRTQPRLLADLTIAAAALHAASAVGRFRPTFRTMAHGGGWNTVDPRDPEPLAAVWFTACGVGLAGLGLVAREAAVTSGRLPRAFGPTLLAIAVPVCLVQPMTGAWILLPLGLSAVRGRQIEGFPRAGSRHVAQIRGASAATIAPARGAGSTRHRPRTVC